MDFRILGNNEGQKKFELYPKGVYVKPAGANCILVRAGKVAFGKIVFDDGFLPIDTDIGAIFFKKARTGSRFFKLPTALGKIEIQVSFPEYYYDDRGHNYGAPEFGDIPLVTSSLLSF